MALKLVDRVEEEGEVVGMVNPSGVFYTVFLSIGKLAGNSVRPGQARENWCGEEKSLLMRKSY